MGSIVHSTFGPSKVSRGAAARSRDVDLALAVMCALQIPGERVSTKVIAEVTGMSHAAPFYIEKRAMKKLRQRLKEFRQQLTWTHAEATA